MRKLSEIEKTQLRGMTINERLYEVGQLESFYTYVKQKNFEKIQEIYKYIEAPDSWVTAMIDSIDENGEIQYE